MSKVTTKHEQINEILKNLSPVEIALAFKVAAHATKPQSQTPADFSLVQDLRQSNTGNNICIAAQKIELVAYL